MPTFTFTSPDGKSYDVTGPDGSTASQAFAILQQQLGSAKHPVTGTDIPVPSYADVNKKPAQAAQKEPSLMDKVVGALETGANLATGATTGAVGLLAGGAQGVLASVRNGTFGTHEGVRQAEDAAALGASALTYEPRTPTGKQYAENVGNAINDSGIVGVPQMELARLIETSAPAAEAAKTAIAARASRKSVPAIAAAERTTAPAIDYDVPAFVRKSKRVIATDSAPVPDLPEASSVAGTGGGSPLEVYAESLQSNSRYGTLIPDERVEIPAASIEAVQKSPLEQYVASHSEGGAVDIPAASAARAELSPLDAYIAEQSGPLFKGEIPQASSSAASPLESYVLSGGAEREISPARFDAFLKENNIASAVQKSPLEKYLNGEQVTAEEARQIAKAELPTPAKPEAVASNAKTLAADIGTEDASAALNVGGFARAEQTPIFDRPLSIMAKRSGDFLSDAEKGERARILQRIGMSQARQSAISGDSLEGAVQAQMSKFLEHPAGVAAKEMFDTERKALQHYGQKIVNQTGGSLGMDEATQNARGQVVATPFDGLRRYFDQAIDALYRQADERSGGMPSTELSGLNDLLGTQSAFAGKSENGALRRGLKAYMREQGIMDKDGSLAPVTPQQAEGIKQYLNGQWSPGTSGLIGKIKDVIDNDVFASAGEDIYAQAREMYKSKKATLDNPSGIAKLFEYDPKTPINRATPFEKIPDTITRLPTAQFGHVLDVLQKIIDPAYKTPETLVLQAYDALNEIKAHMLNKLMDIGSQYKGQWNANGVTQYIKSNTAKFRMLFTDQELAQVLDLNDAGHILAVDASYPGAAAQAQIAMKRGLLPNVVGKGLAGLGGLTGAFGGPIGASAGAAVGSAAGEKVASSIAGNSALKHFNSGIVDLSNSSAAPTSAIDRLKNSTAASILRDAVNAVEESGLTAAAQAPAVLPYAAPEEVGIINSRRENLR